MPVCDGLEIAEQELAESGLKSGKGHSSGARHQGKSDE